MAGPTKILTVKEVSDYLRVNPSTIYRLLKKGVLPAFKVGSDWRFDLEAIDEWRRQQSIQILASGSNSPPKKPKKKRSSR